MTMLQRVALCCSVFPVCCSVLQRVAVCCSVLQCVTLVPNGAVDDHVAVCCSVLQCVAARCSVLQCAAVCCSVLQCAAVCCSVLQCVTAVFYGAVDHHVVYMILYECTYICEFT